jgi:hypothetical protein
LKHGLTSQEIVIGDEDPRQFDQLREGLNADFEPQTTIERELVERLAGLLWRLRRVPVFEAALMHARIREIEESKPSDDYEMEMFLRKVSDAHLRELTQLFEKWQSEPAKPIAPTPPVRDSATSENRKIANTGLALILDSENHDSFGKLSRYEAGLLSAVTRTLSLLHSLRTSGLLANKQAPKTLK